MEVSTTGLGNRDLEQFAAELSRIKQRLDIIEVGLRTGQLGNSSVENGYLSFYDDDGIERARVGKQTDGTYSGGVSQNNNIPPPVPNTPVAEPVIAGVRVKSTGPTSGTWPADFSHINVWQADGPGLEGRIVGTIIGRNENGTQGVFVAAPLAAGTGPYRFWLTAVNTSKAESAPSDEVTASPLAVVGQDILDGAINELQLADDAVTQAKIAAGAVGTAEIAGQAVDLSKLADGSVSAAQLIDGAVETEKIATEAVVAELIAANAIIAGKIAANAVTAVTIAANAISAEKIAANAISAEKIAANAITAEKILALAITSDKIAANSIAAGHIQAGAVTASKLEADMVIANRLIAGTATGARTELHPTAGLQAFTAAGLRTLWADAATGDLTAVGTYRSGITGERVEILPDGTMRMYGATGTDYAQMANDGGIVRFQSRADASNRRTFTELNPSGFAAYYGTTAGAYTSARSGLDTGATYTVVRAPVCGSRVLTQFTPDDSTDHRVFIVFANASGDLGPSVWHFMNDANNGRGTLIGASADAGLKPEGGVVNIVKGNGDNYAPCRAESHIVPSGLATKTNIGAVADRIGTRAVDVVRAAPARAWQRSKEALPPRPAKPGHKLRRTEGGRTSWVDAEWDWTETPRPTRFGPIADDLEAVSPLLVERMYDGELCVDLGSLAGIAWAAAADNADDVDALRREVERLRALIDPEPPVLDGELVEPALDAIEGNGNGPGAERMDGVSE